MALLPHQIRNMRSITFSKLIEAQNVCLESLKYSVKNIMEAEDFHSIQTQIRTFICVEKMWSNLEQASLKPKMDPQSSESHFKKI